jgi:hypothetical protein
MKGYNFGAIFLSSSGQKVKSGQAGRIGGTGRANDPRKFRDGVRERLEQLSYHTADVAAA